MRTKRLGCFTGIGIISALITLLAVAGMAFASGGSMFSPGSLNADQGQPLGGVSSHAQIAGECKACHAAPWQAETMEQLCTACHANIADELKDFGSIHGKLKVIDPAAECRDCHPEHKGPHAALTVLEEWNFPHQVTGYLLDGHQARAQNEPFLCSDCHGGDVTSFAMSVCSDCHKQSNEIFMLDHGIAFGTNCLNCHDGLDTFGKKFDHNALAFPLSGRHSIPLCSQCHLATSKISDLKLTPQTCFACHGASDDPHGGKLGTDCASCHSTTGWKPANFDHNRAAFSLTGAHVTLACESCHLDKSFVGAPKDCVACHQQDDPHAARFGTDCAACHNPSSWKDWKFDHTLADFQLTGKHTVVDCEACHTSGYRGTPKDCFSCHRQDEPHAGQFGTACEGCHVTAGWDQVTFNHSNTAFALTGLHASVTCKACHANGVYRGTPKNCYACHAARDAHKGQFGTNCGTCHVTTGWRNVNFNHNTTAFPLTGRHMSAVCTACHQNGVFRGTSKACITCHASKDRHNGQFGTDCSACHNTTGWTGATFNHSNTRFPLSGRHASLACSNCHANGVYRGTPVNCIACHASNDRHNGQFGTDCSACHNTNGWAGATFNHNNTRFPLSGRHTSLACSTCHANGVYRGTPANCAACHASDDRHNGQFGSDCSACHSTNSWTGASFNHNNTSFPLFGRHVGLACSTCHANGVYRGTPSNCYACHASDDNHGGRFGTNCGSCHNTNGWGGASFDHNITSFPLEGKHRGLACESCHRNGVYQGLSTSCSTCHEDKHNGEKGPNCADCHTPQGWGD